MRADVQEIFNELTRLLNTKKNLLNILLDREKKISDLLKYRYDPEDEILKIIDEESELIEKISSGEFNITCLKDQLSLKYNFDFGKISQKNYTSPETEIMQAKDLVQTIHNLTTDLLNLKHSNNSRMNESMKKLKVQIDELERMGRIKIIYPKDLQSS